MPGNAERPKSGRLTFRLKILVALMGVVLLMAGILLLVLERETSIQIETAIRGAVGKSRDNYQEMEGTWKAELASVFRRFADSPRILSAFDAALDEGDPGVLAGAAEYETKLAAISGYLILFIDSEGRVVCTLLEGQRQGGTVENPRPDMNALQSADPFGYILFRGQMYVTHTESLSFFAHKLGFMLVGFPLREKVVQSLGEWVEGQVCFVVGSTAVIFTPGIAQSALLKQMEAAAVQRESRILVFSGQTWALFSEFLNPRRPGEGSKVYAIPLDKTLAPFKRFRMTLILAALATLVSAVALGFFLSRGLSAPILELVKGTDQVARGNYDFQVHITSKDELGILGNAFNTMVHGLFLKEKYRDVLDKVVSPEIAQEMLKGDLFLGGEDRVVTVLFADIRGFSSMTEGMDPREIITILNEYLEGASAEIENEAGVVDKYIGDEIMAIFGAPVSHPDDAQRAIRAALRMLDTLRMRNASRQAAGRPEIAIGIGISTGLVVAGNMGSRSRLNYTVLGEPVNLAARLCSMAGAGQILISSATLEAAGPGLDCQALGPVILKGISDPVGIWLVKGWQAS